MLKKPYAPTGMRRLWCGMLIIGMWAAGVHLYADEWVRSQITECQGDATQSAMTLTLLATPGLLYAWETNRTMESGNWGLAGAPQAATASTVTSIVSMSSDSLFVRARAHAPVLTCLTTSTTVNGAANVAARQFSWVDANGGKRVALMLDQTTTRAGVLRQLTYAISNATRVCSAVPANNNAIQGMGYVVNHIGTGSPWGNWSAASAVNANGLTTNVLSGRHHHIIQYSLPSYSLGGKTIPTYVQWFFATGRPHPLFHVTQDARTHTAGNIGGDTRSPYGTMYFAGDGRTFPQPDDYKVGGVSWGDTYKFYTVDPITTNESTTLRAASGWIYDESNSIPYAMAWMTTANAEQGTVATAPITQQDHGSDPRIYPQTGFKKNQRDLNGPMIKGDDWAYQMMNYPDIPTNGTYDTKIGWGANFGILGGFDNWDPGTVDKVNFSLHRNSTTPWTGSRTNGLFLSYSTFIVFGEHSGGVREGATGKAVRQVENLHGATLTATVGSVKTQGPASPVITNAATRMYSPAGYNPTYAVWEIAAFNNGIDVSLSATASKPISNPVFRILAYTATTLPAVYLDEQLATSDSDYFVSLDTARHELWITIHRTASSALRVRIP